MQKGLAPLVIIVLIGLAVGGILLYQKQFKPAVAPQQTTQSSPNSITFDETTNWKTYIDNAIKISFQYPQNWSDDISDQQYFESGVILHTKDVDFTDFSNFRRGALIYKFLIAGILPKKDFVDLAAVMEEYGKPRKGESIISENILTLDGQTAKKRIIKGNNHVAVILVFQYPNNLGYSWLTMLSSLDSFKSNQNTLDQILSTFKFLDQNQITDTSAWKNLNNKYGFSLQYPANLKAFGVGIQVNETTAPIVIIARDPEKPKDSDPNFNINVIGKQGSVYQNLTLEEGSSRNYEANLKNKNTFIKVVESLKSTTLDGQQAFTYTLMSKGYSGEWGGWAGESVRKLKVIESEFNNKYFILVTVDSNSVFDQILSTFKFLP